MNPHRESYPQSSCGGQSITSAVPQPLTRLEVVREREFSALMRLRDMQMRANAIADRLLGTQASNGPSNGPANSCSTQSEPLVSAIEETTTRLHDAIDRIEEALDRLNSL